MDKRRVLIGSGIVVLAFGGGVAVGAQEHMEAALHALENAKAELAVAEHNKGGHREKAAHLVDQAINQVREGIRAGR